MAICQQWFAREGRPGQRRMWGLVGLARRHPATLVEQACTRAALQQRVTLKAITLMVNELADAAPESAPPTLTQQHELIRDARDYAEFFAAATSDAQPAGEWLQ